MSAAAPMRSAAETSDPSAAQPVARATTAERDWLLGANSAASAMSTVRVTAGATSPGPSAATVASAMAAPVIAAARTARQRRPTTIGTNTKAGYSLRAVATASRTPAPPSRPRSSNANAATTTEVVIGLTWPSASP